THLHRLWCFQLLPRRSDCFVEFHAQGGEHIVHLPLPRLQQLLGPLPHVKNEDGTARFLLPGVMEEDPFLDPGPWVLVSKSIQNCISPHRFSRYPKGRLYQTWKLIHGHKIKKSSLP